MCTKNHNHDVLFLNPHNDPENQNLEKVKKNTCRYYPFIHKHHKWRSCDVWFLKCKVWKTEFFVILGDFLPFYLTNNPLNQNFEKTKTLRDIIILNMCTINNNHNVWFLTYGVQWTEFFVILDHFFPFTPLMTQKIKILKKWKTKLEISSIYTRIPKIIITCYTIPEIQIIYSIY